MEHEEVNKDSRRTLTQLMTADIKQVNVYEVEPNVTIGNHYHKETVEYFYILDGEIDANGKHMVAGDLFAFYPQEMHTLVSRTWTRFMTFLTKPFNKLEPDLWKS